MMRGVLLHALKTLLLREYMLNLVLAAWGRSQYTLMFGFLLLGGGVNRHLCLASCCLKDEPVCTCV